MHLRAPEIKLDPKDPFATDLLGRRSTAESMTQLARTATDGLVVSLHAPWGSGKTTFLSMWRQHLKKEGFNTLSFNAWETDFTDDALIALLGELEIGLTDTNATNGPSKFKSSIGKAKKIGFKLLRSAIPTAIRVATAGAIKLDDLTEEAISEWTGKLAEDQINAYESARNSIHEFRKSIEEIAKIAITDTQNPLPLIFIVDELDRCKPTYAIRVLECIKHFFAVPGVMFVLAVDSTQLSHAVRSQYGQSMDATGYLRRFFDIELTLPEPADDAFLNAQFERFKIDHKLNERKISHGKFGGEQNDLKIIFNELFHIFRCSLRDRERCFTLLSFALRFTPDNQPIHPSIIALLIVLKIKDAALYVKFRDRTVSHEEVLKIIQAKPGGADFLGKTIGMRIETTLHIILNKNIIDRYEISKEYDLKSNNSTDTFTRNKYSEQSMMYNNVESDEMATLGTLERLLSKIDLIAK
jgi:hypothetical protein